MKKFLAVSILAIAAALAGCDKEVPQDIVDGNMTITRLNAQKNADAYFGVQYPAGAVDANPALGEPIRALMQSDSSVSKQCRNGDGWASGVIQYKNGKTLKIKCQTNGTGKGINGCMSETEFATKTYKDEEGRCQNLESLEKFK
jgi:hypothetical protein